MSYCPWAPTPPWVTDILPYQPVFGTVALFCEFDPIFLLLQLLPWIPGALGTKSQPLWLVWDKVLPAIP